MSAQVRTARLIASMMGIVVVLTAVFVEGFDRLIINNPLLLLLGLVVLAELLISPPIIERLPEVVALCLMIGFTGACAAAEFLLLSTYVLGHVRAMWMEFENALPAAAFGFVVGTFLALPIWWLGKRGTTN